MKDVHKVLPPGLLGAAVPGNKRGVSLAYGHAAAWLRQDEAPPPELCAWLADRLEALQRALWAEDDKPDAAVMVAIGAREPGKRGRKAAGEDQRDRDQQLVWEVLAQQRRNPRLKLDAIFAAVAENWPVPQHKVTEATVRKAWRRHKDFIPE